MLLIARGASCEAGQFTPAPTANLASEEGMGGAVCWHAQPKGSRMNKDQAKGAVKDVAGKVQEQAGKLSGSKEQQAKGVAKQGEGKLQKGYGNLKEKAKDTLRD